MKTPKEMIDEIVAAGWRQQDIVNATGLKKSFISELRSARYKDMLHSHYVKLQEFHRTIMRRRPRRKDVA